MSYEVEQVDLPAQPAAVVLGHADVSGIPGFLGQAFGEVMGLLAEQHISPSGPPFARFHVSDGGFDIEAGFPCHRTVSPQGRVRIAVLPEGHAVKTVHQGSYDQVSKAYDALSDWILENGNQPAGDPWESYLDEPEVPEPRTLVFAPYRPARHDT